MPKRRLISNHMHQLAGRDGPDYKAVPVGSSYYVAEACADRDSPSQSSRGCLTHWGSGGPRLSQGDHGKLSSLAILKSNALGKTRHPVSCHLIISCAEILLIWRRRGTCAQEEGKAAREGPGSRQRAQSAEAAVTSCTGVISPLYRTQQPAQYPGCGPALCR